MKKLLVATMYVLFCIVFVVFLAVPLYAQQSLKEPPDVLNSVKTAIDSSLKKIDGRLIMASKKAALSGIKGRKTGQALLGLCRSVPGSIDCATVDLSGRMVTVMPAKYKKYKGTDISGQEQVIRLQKTGKPVFSHVFRSVEGIDAVDIEYPVYLKNKKLAGAVSLLLSSEAFLASVIVPALNGLPHEAWLMQKDGRILYDKDSKQIGLMLFEDPLYRPYENLLAAGRKIAGDKKGAGSYEFLAVGKRGTVRRNIVWDTVVLYGVEWRLVVVDVVDAAARKVPMPGSDRDAHGCIGSAGYSWCESSHKCLRIWEEPCP
ncbi:MAG: cache domain-containing protein [Deltaproteobacteria bacterium]|nr:cache domain-containing protein [Deltaproteobacteria bacterium]